MEDADAEEGGAVSEPLDEETAIMAFKAILAQLADDIARQNVLSAVLEGRCRKCLDVGGKWCCYDSRGD